MLTIFYIVATCFGAIISPSSGSRHQNLFKTYSNKTGQVNIHMLWCQLPDDGEIIQPKNVGAV